jgi:hypothetical protein
MKLINAGVTLVLLVVLGIIGINQQFPSSLQGKTAPSIINQGQMSYLPILISNQPTPTPPPPTPTPTPPSTPPIYSTSYYMLTVDSTTLYNMGCKLGQYDRNLPGSRETVVVLDFGSPKKVGNEYGADLFWMGPVTNTQITNAVKNFGIGYYTCVAGDSVSKIYVGIGTTNYHTNISNTTDFWNHGVAWANMVNGVNAYFVSQGYSGQVLAVGADDIELSWNTSAISKAWVNGYNSTHKYDWYNFGTLDGCATRSWPNYDKCANGWTRDDAWYATYGTSPVWPLPEIYLENGVNAQQWALLSLYSNMYKGYTFQFVGVFTQMQACAQSPGQCPGVNNTPYNGWTQLYNELKSDVRTADIPPWSTDIKWWDGIVSGGPTPTVNKSIDSTNGQIKGSLYKSLADKLQSELSSPDLQPDARQLLQAKMDNVQRVIADQATGAANPASKNAKVLPAAPKVINPDFLSGIFDGAGGTFHAWEGEFSNHWQGNVDGQFVFVSAGKQADDPTQGIVMVMTVSGDRLQVHKEIIKSSAGSGALQVTQAAWPLITLSTSTSQTLTFNVQTNTFQ